MNPAELDALLASRKKPGSHGERNCPECRQGYMRFIVMGSSHAYQCVDCKWVEFKDPPWPEKEPRS